MGVVESKFLSAEVEDAKWVKPSCIDRISVME
jgi:hypothetical protein